MFYSKVTDKPAGLHLVVIFNDSLIYLNNYCTCFFSQISLKSCLIFLLVTSRINK